MWAPHRNMTSCSATWISPSASTCCPAARASITSGVSNHPHPSVHVEQCLSPGSDVRACHTGSVHEKRKSRVSVCFHASQPPEWVGRTETSPPAFPWRESANMGRLRQPGGVACLPGASSELRCCRTPLPNSPLTRALPSPVQGGAFWSITSFGTFRPWGKFALNFCIELQGSNLLTVLAPNGFYMRSDRSGTLLADSEDITKECIWEF